MSQPHWFDIVGPEYQAQVIKVLNRRSFHLPAFVPKQDSIPFEKYYAGLLTGDLLRKFRREAREAWKDQPLGLERLREVVRWRDDSNHCIRKFESAATRGAARSSLSPTGYPKRIAIDHARRVRRRDEA